MFPALYNFNALLYILLFCANVYSILARIVGRFYVVLSFSCLVDVLLIASAMRDILIILR